MELDCREDYQEDEVGELEELNYREDELGEPSVPLWDAPTQQYVLEAITRALAPTGTESVDLPEQQADDINGLYESLTAPLPTAPSREDKLARFAATDTSEEGFWRWRERGVDEYAFLVRCFGARRDLAGAQARNILENCTRFSRQPHHPRTLQG